MKANSRPCRKEGVHRQDLPDGSTLLFDPESETAFPVTSSAALVWDECDGANTIEVIVGKLTEVYDVEADTAAEDVDALIESLADSGLITFPSDTD